MTTIPKLDEFTQSYLETALWASTDNSTESGGYPLDDNYGVDDFAPEALAQAIADCKDFQELAGERIAHDLGRAGHDFWLTRNRHGAGFWDGDWPEVDGEWLTEMSHPYGECDIYVGDDGRLYLQ
jgi:hypothetical protein